MLIRSLAVLILALVFAAPGLAQAPQSPSAEEPAALRLMNDAQFKEFLKRLDADMVSWKARLRVVDLGALRSGAEDVREIRRSYSLCMLALENARGDIRQLTQKQTLKLNFLLLVDLHALARSLDRLSGELASPITVEKASSAQRSLGWAREVLSIDTALAAHLNEMQHHVLALAGLVDAALERAEQSTPQSRK